MRSVGEVPGAVRAARSVWFVAIGAGILETVLVVATGRAGGGAPVGATVRAAVFTAAFFVTLRMAAGRPWARWALTVGLGVFGLLSLVVGPLIWLVQGNSVGQVLRESGLVDLLFGASRVVHVAAVISACVLMFLPASNAYFRNPARVQPAISDGGLPTGLP